MKKYIIAALFALFTQQVFAQEVVDIKNLYSTTPEAIKAKYGEPKPYDPEMYFSDYIPFKYEHFYIGLWHYSQSNTYALEYFATGIPDFCVMSNSIDGGIKVGDSFEKLLNFDFVNCKYGRGKPGNGLQDAKDAYQYGYEINSHRANYIVFKEEWNFFLFAVEDGVITAIFFDEAEDMPYLDYDASNHIWKL